MRQFQMSKQSWRKRSMSAADITGDLPIYSPAAAVGRRESISWSSRSEMSYKLIHLIPLVVMVCFFILWCFSSPVDLETKDGRTTFVPRAKKSQQTSEAADLDLTVLALESPPDGFLLVSDGPYALLGLRNQSNGSSTDLNVQNASLSVPHELKAPSSISHEPSALLSDFSGPGELVVDLREPNTSFAVSHDVKLSFPVSDEPRVPYPGKSNKTAPKARGEG